MSFGIVRIAKISDYGSIKASAEHTYRERETKNADPKRTPLNHGTGPRSAQGVLDAVKNRLEKIQVSGDSVLVVEYFVGASAEFFKLKTSAEVDKFFADSLKEIERKHGKKNVIASDVQLDELTPHLAVYVVPIVEKLAVGTRKRAVKTTKVEFEATGEKTKIIEVANKATENLGAKTFFGTREKMRALQDDFQKNVFEKYGLIRGKKVEETNAKHETVKQFYDDLKPRMQAAQQMIDQAEHVKKTQEKKEAELHKLAVGLSSIRDELTATRKFMQDWAKRLKEQEERLMEAFALLPGTLQAKLEAIFQPIASETPPEPPKRTSDLLPTGADTSRTPGRAFQRLK